MVMVNVMAWTTKTMAMIDVDDLDDDDDDDDDDNDNLSGFAFKYWSFDTLSPLYLFSGIVFWRITCPVVHHGNF